MHHHTTRRSSIATWVVVFIMTLGVAALAAPNAQAQDLPGPLYTIKGTIYDAEGNALQGAVVVLRPAGGGSPQSAQSDASGKYSVGSLSAGTYNVTADHDCCAPGFQQVVVSGTSLERIVDFTLIKQEPPISQKVVTIQGVVKNMTSGAPVAGARIGINNWFTPSDAEDDNASSTTSEGYAYPDRQGYQWWELYSSEDGSYILELNAGGVEIFVDHPDFDYARGSFQVDANRTIDIPLRAASQGSVTLKGVLKSTDGKPIAGWVSVSPDYESRCDGDVCYAYAEPAYAPEGNGNGEFWYESRYGQYASTETQKDGSWELTVFAGRLRVYGSANTWPEEYIPAEKKDKHVLLLVSRIRNKGVV